MFRHLLVPVDGTDPSAALIGHAIGLARPLGASITFFHVTTDAAAALFGEAGVAGRARERLAKAEAAAHAFGVSCRSSHAVGDHAEQAVLDAARAHGCDLILVHPPGPGGALSTGGLPLLVAASADPASEPRAVGILRDAHRSIAEVVHAGMHALAEARHREGGVAVATMRDIVQYLKTFALLTHHPRQEKHLFARLRERTHRLDPELDELELQHERDRLLVDELSDLVDGLDSPDPLDREMTTRRLEGAVGRYANFLWAHLGREEGVILPAAQRHLTADDWAEIGAAFAEDTDPDLPRLFARITQR